MHEDSIRICQRSSTILDDNNGNVGSIQNRVLNLISALPYGYGHDLPYWTQTCAALVAVSDDIWQYLVT